MKFLTIIFSICVIVPFSVKAENFATIINVIPNYSYGESYSNKKSCSVVEQPIYGRQVHRGANGSDVLTGMIIGGLFGKGLTGKKQGATAGAIIGGIIAADATFKNHSIVGYKPVTKCQTIRTPITMKNIKNYRIDYKWRGVVGSSYTYNEYKIGQIIPIAVKIIAK